MIKFPCSRALFQANCILVSVMPFSKHQDCASCFSCSSIFLITPLFKLPLRAASSSVEAGARVVLSRPLLRLLMPRRGLPFSHFLSGPCPGYQAHCNRHQRRSLSIYLKPPTNQIQSDHRKGEHSAGEPYASDNTFSEVATKRDLLPFRLGLFGLWLSDGQGIDVQRGTWQIFALAFRDFSSAISGAHWLRTTVHGPTSLTLVWHLSQYWYSSGKSLSGDEDQLVLSQLGQIKSGIEFISFT